jgi:DnaJ family protein C protein 28
MDWGKLVEQKIREAQESGDFDRLPNKGALDYSDEQDIPEDLRMAYHLLKTQGYAPDWIEADKALRIRLDQARQSIARSWLWYQAKLSESPIADQHRMFDAEWRRARERFETAVAELNKEVFNHNLRVPSMQLQRLPLRLSEEYKALGIPE